MSAEHIKLMEQLLFQTQNAAIDLSKKLFDAKQKLKEAEIVQDICLRYINGEWQDLSSLAADYGGMGLEKNELCIKVGRLAEEVHEKTITLEKIRKLTE